MIDEIFNLMECFEGCFVNRFGELIISDRGNVYFTAKGCKDKTDIICTFRMVFQTDSKRNAVCVSKKKPGVERKTSGGIQQVSWNAIHTN